MTHAFKVVAPGKQFWLAIVDNDCQRFALRGPLLDDRPIIDAVVRAQDQGRQVKCSTITSVDDARRHYLSLGYLEERIDLP